ncbi:MAG: hypothetical protein LBP71_02235 [Spirochaetaceae bacterium]|nr:hypothetical protein [Spirochaetaceae bacterium]
MLLFFPVRALFGADITVPRLEWATRAASEGGEFVVSSAAAADIALEGGYKYGALLGLSFESADLGKALAYRNFTLQPGTSDPPTQSEYNALVDRMNNQAVLSFRIAKATARNLFNLPLEVSYFIGIADNFCSGDDFVSRFGTAPIGTGFRGFYYFPTGIDGNISHQYNGIHGVRGTGLSFSLSSWDFIVPMFYIYQDFSFVDETLGISENGHYSGDLRVLFNREKFKMEAFMGGTVSKSSDPIIRGGLLAYFSSGMGTEFLLQFGVPGWAGEDFSIDNFYFLIEPRIDFGLLATHITFFYHPLIYLQKENNSERGKADINMKVFAGDLGESGLEGGLEITTGLKVGEMENFSIYASPFASFVTTGLRWDVKIRLDLRSFDDPGSLLALFMGIRTAY